MRPASFLLLSCLEEQDCRVSEVHVNEMTRLVGDIADNKTDRELFLLSSTKDVNQFKTTAVSQVCNRHENLQMSFDYFYFNPESRISEFKPASHRVQKNIDNRLTFRSVFQQRSAN